MEKFVGIVIFLFGCYFLWKGGKAITEKRIITYRGFLRHEHRDGNAEFVGAQLLLAGFGFLIAGILIILGLLTDSA